MDEEKRKQITYLIIEFSAFMMMLVLGMLFSYFGGEGFTKYLPLLFGLTAAAVVILAAVSIEKIIRINKEAKVMAAKEPSNPEEKLIKSLKDSEDIDIAKIIANKRDRSSIVSSVSGEIVPTVLIYTLGTGYYRVADGDEGAVEKNMYPRLKAAWLEALETFDKTHVSDFYDENMEFSVARYEEFCYGDYARQCTDSVKKYIKEKINKAPYRINAYDDATVEIVAYKEDLYTLYTDEIRDDIEKWIKDRGKKYVSGKYEMDMDCLLKVVYKGRE